MSGRRVAWERAPRAVASAPGKLILMGEHAAVYGRPALVAAVGLRVEARATLAGESGVLLDLPDLGYRAALEWPELLETARRARAAWARYSRDPTPASFREVSTGDPGRLVRIALGEAAGEIGSSELPPLTLEVRSELPLGSGFGSSAAIAVGVLASSLTLLEAEPSLDTLDRLALEVERRQHGQPSGVDHGTVLRGGVLAVRRDGEGGEPVLEPVEVPASTLDRFRVVQSGRPAETTGEVVAAVRELGARDRTSFERLLDRMGANVVSFSRLLAESEPDWPRLAKLMDDYEECLEEMGVVPMLVRKALAAARAEGAAAKVSGAGGLSEAGAGSLLVLTGESGELPDALAAYRPQPVTLGAPGLAIEVES